MDKTPLKITRKTSAIFISLPSTLENIDKVSKEAKKFLLAMGITSSETIFATDLVLREGLTNAVRHGHNNNPDKIAKFSLDYENNTITMVIEDSGNGFNWKVCKDIEANIENDHGRGFSIMKEYFTTYEYNKKGNKLTLVKKLNP